MTKDNSKTIFLKKQLENPNIEEWEKKNIRRKLGIYTKIIESDFEKEENDKYISFFSDFIEEQINRLNRVNRTHNSFENFSENIKSIHYLSSFSSFFESDSFKDYSENKILDDEVWLHEERDGLLNGLIIIGLNKDANNLKKIWNQNIISENEIEMLQNKYWNTEFSKMITKKIIELIKTTKQELLNLQL
ncbi:hypothetical protein [uncultured Maribacter sp.]|uniref:hypothetical protein n=1 Tax=uncultured Maribacter sp. TaxID=431308 RepID=UPI0026097D37|nr:hypothetical protein [uncultured Maribacter sp.]